jgi:hypothetical protein
MSNALPDAKLPISRLGPLAPITVEAKERGEAEK